MCWFLMAIIGSTLCAPTESCLNEFFIGKIVYEFEYKSMSGENSSSNMFPYLGIEQHYYINEYNYKSYNEKGILTQLYNSKTNKYFFVNPSTQEVYEVDARENTSPIVEIQYSKEEDIVLGFKCLKLTIITKYDKTTYWYSDSLSVPYKNFINHKYGNWAAFLEATNGALPLKYTTENGLYVITAKAKLIQKINFLETDFEILNMLETK